MSSPSSISDFYAGANVFVTGGTGFLGKVVVEKLLRSCEGIRSIYVLVKPKRGLDCEERLRQLRESRVFDRIRESSPGCLDKIRGVQGDIEKPHLGVTSEDKSLILDTVHVVIHSAATVHFGQDFKSTVLTNTFGTKRVAELCKEIRHLRCFVYVSTAYCNVDKDVVEEVVYEPPYTLETLRGYITKMPPKATNLLGRHANAYTISKAFAEKMISQYARDYPIAIVRPSIINSSWKEPYPGWVDSNGGATMVIMLLYLGLLRDFFISGPDLADIIPVDVVVNTIITAAWYIGINRPSAPKVYNCTSGRINGVTWREFIALSCKYTRKYPTKRALRYPTAWIEQSRLWFKLGFFFNQTVPFFMYDTLLKCMGRKSRLLGNSFMGKKNLLASEFVTMRTFHFRTANFKELTQEVGKCKDRAKFSMDMASCSGFNWDAYMESYILGIRQYILRDDLDSLEGAKIKLKIIYWILNITWTTILFLLFICCLFTVYLLLLCNWATD